MNRTGSDTTTCPDCGGIMYWDWVNNVWTHDSPDEGMSDEPDYEGMIEADNLARYGDGEDVMTMGVEGWQ